MPRNIWKYLIAARQAFLAAHAEDLASRGKALRSMKTLNKCYKYYGVDMPARNAPIELNILLSQVSIAVENGPMALSSAEMAISQLESGHGIYCPESRQYLIRFCEAIAIYCKKWRYGNTYEVDDVELSGLDLSRVDARIRSRFILPADGRFI
jgi:hypothetical protein